MSMEEVGNEYFNSLLYSSFFQVVDKSSLGEVTLFKMHDLVHDLANDVANDRECFFLTVDEYIETIPNVRRLALHDFNEGMSKTVGKVLQDKTKLRTLLCNGSVEKIENAFDSLRRLRVLDFSHASNVEDIPWSLIDNLKHLRYLDLSNTKIANLLESITRLYHLQTLRLKGCTNIKEIPKGISKLINLRHLFLPDDMNLPMEIRRLSSLQTLTPINIGDSAGIQVLEGLNLLNGYIEINNLRNVTCGIDAERANLKGKKNLQSIILSWRFRILVGEENSEGAREEDDRKYDKDEVVLEALRPHPKLKLLVIDQYFGARLPWWMGDPSCLPNLLCLELSSCTKCKQLVGFGKLPSLKVFVLNGMNSLEEWVDMPAAPTQTRFPRLEDIRIVNCPNLKITPTRFSSLKKLFLWEINERVALPLITENLNSLEYVELEKISELRFLPHRLLQGSNLRELKVFDCIDFQGFLPKEEEGLQQQAQFFPAQILLLCDLPNLKFLPDIQSFTSLEYLTIENCGSFKPLPEDLTCLSSSLENLKLVEIRKVKGVADFKWER